MSEETSVIKKGRIVKPVIALVGPTAIGKTALSLEIASRFCCEIVSLDSMQVYRYLDIGTAKASLDEQAAIPHHLIDLVDPDEHYDVSRYVQDACEVIDAIHRRGKIPLVTGGTGLYLRALTSGLFETGRSFPRLREDLQRRLEEEGAEKLYSELQRVDPQMAAKIHPHDRHRLIRGLEIFYGTRTSWSDHLAEQRRQSTFGNRFKALLALGLHCERTRLYERINRRSEIMLQHGLKEEVEGLLSAGYDRNLQPMQAIGYRHMIWHIEDRMDLAECVRLLARDTRRYAKRQYTWFRKMDIRWFERGDHNHVLEAIRSFLMRQSPDGAPSKNELA